MKAKVLADFQICISVPLTVSIVFSVYGSIVTFLLPPGIKGLMHYGPIF